MLAVGCSSPKPEPNPSGPFVYVEGQVRKPGRFPWTSGMTLQDAIGLAGGFSDFASKPLRVRHSDGTEENFRASRDGQLLNNAPVRPGDVLFSPYD